MEEKFRELIEAKGQTDGLYLSIHPKRECNFLDFNVIDGKKVVKFNDILMALLDDDNKVELLCSSPDDTRREFIYFSQLSKEIQFHIFSCFKEQ
ncbi:MAG: hypothetical protein ACI4N3_01605 [Alphaproteobacteria bacterium]